MYILYKENSSDPLSIHDRATANLIKINKVKIDNLPIVCLNYTFINIVFDLLVSFKQLTAEFTLTIFHLCLVFIEGFPTVIKWNHLHLQFLIVVIFWRKKIPKIQFRLTTLFLAFIYYFK